MKWIEAFRSWPEVTVKLGRPEEETAGEATVAMPRLLQVHVAGLYAATGARVPDEVQDIALPERPDAPDVGAFLADAGRALERLYEELEAVVTGDSDLLERVRQDFDQRIARGEWWRGWLESTRELLDAEERSPEAEYYLRRELEQRALVTELLERMKAFPSLQGDRKIPVDEEALLQLYREALEIVDRFRSWTADTDRIEGLIDLVIEDPEWQVTESTNRNLWLWKERLQNSSSPEACETDKDLDEHSAVSTMPKGPVPEALLGYARWLRFPYLPSPDPGPLAKTEGRTRKRAARWLLRETLPGGPIEDDTLQNYLSRARQHQ